MFKKIGYHGILLVILPALLLLTASYACAQSFNKTVDDFCSALTNKDIISIHTRAILKPFFYSDDDMSNFVVSMNIKIQQAGFGDSIVRSCKPLTSAVKGSSADQVLDISGKGKVFFIKKHLLISTHWIEQSSRWYLEVPSVISNPDVQDSSGEH